MIRDLHRFARPAGARLRLLLVRHGEPEVSSRGRCYGKLDVGLSEEGRLRMVELAKKVSGAGIATVYASPRRRARESAGLLAGLSALPIEIDGRFAEMDFGDIEGRTYDEVREWWPELYERWMERPTAVEFPGGETFETMRRRVLAAASAVRERHEDASVAIVSHGGVNRILLAEALGMEPEAIFRIGQSYAALNVIDYFGDTPVVHLVNGTC